MLLVALALSAKADPDERVMITIALKLEKKGITKKLTHFSCYHDKQKYKGPREAPFGKVGSNNDLRERPIYIIHKIRIIFL